MKKYFSKEESSYATLYRGWVTCTPNIMMYSKGIPVPSTISNDRAKEIQNFLEELKKNKRSK